MAYGIWLSVNDGEEGFQLPINPRDISMSDGNKGQTYDISKLGEINVIQEKQLTDYSFSSFFPSRYYPFVATDTILEPAYYIDLLNDWMEQKEPVRFIFTGDSFDINTLVSIEGFDWREKAGEVGDVEYTLNLKQYRNFSPKKVKVVIEQQRTSVQKNKPQRQNTRRVPETYRLVAGDSLWKVAEKFYNDGTRCWEIQRLNNIPDSELRRLPIGLEIRLPPE